MAGGEIEFAEFDDIKGIVSGTFWFDAVKMGRTWKFEMAVLMGNTIDSI